MRGVWRAFTPLGWMVALTAIGAVVLAVTAFDPLGLKAAKQAHLLEQARQGGLHQKARELEAAAQTRLENRRADQRQTLDILTIETGKQAGRAGDDPSGQIQLGGDRRDRLREHDSLLCQGSIKPDCRASGGTSG